jgi:hypothetical protein
LLVAREKEGAVGRQSAGYKAGRLGASATVSPNTQIIHQVIELVRQTSAYAQPARNRPTSEHAKSAV